MRKSVKKVIALLTASVMALGIMGCSVGGGNSGSTAAAPAANTESAAAASESAPAAESGTSSLKGQNVRVVVGSTSTSGDSYMIADLVTRYLSKEMGFNGKVDAIGNAAALEEMLKKQSYPTHELSVKEAELQYYALGKMTECMVPWNKIYLASLYGEGEERLWYPPGKVFEDGYITYRLIWRAKKIVTIDAPLYYYRQWRGGIMKKNGNKNYADAMGCSIEKMDFYKAQGERELYLKEVNYSVYNVIRFYKAGGTAKDKKEIRKWFKRFYYEYFAKEKWPLAKTLRVKSFLLGYPCYAALSAFEGIYNKLHKQERS